MKTRLLFTLLFIAFIQLAFAQTTSIPDPNFEQALIDLGIDSDGVINGQVLTADIENVLTLDVENKNIVDLTGIEDFSSLEELNCGDNQLTFLNIAQNSLLSLLDTRYNQLNSIDVTQNTALTQLRLSVNQLNSVDVSQNINLVFLSVSENLLTDLDISQNINLESLYSNTNQLVNLDMTQNIEIISLNCLFNQLTSINVSNNTLLAQLAVSGNQLTSLDISNNALLENVNTSYNLLESLNLKNGNTIGILNMQSNNNPNLECIQVDEDIVDNVPVAGWNYDTGVTFSEDCEYLGNIDNGFYEIAIYPNPTNNKIMVATENGNNIESLQLYSIMGKQLLITNSAEIDLSALPTGMYLLKVKTNNGIISKKVIKE